MAKKKVYTIKTKFVFEGVFFVRANNKAQAKQYIKDHCGLVIGGNIHSTLPDEDINWNFCLHPEKIVR